MAINDTMGSNGLVPSLLVFRKVPSFPSPSRAQKRKEERFSVSQRERAEMATIVAEKRIKTALRIKFPTATRYVIRLGEK